MSSRVYLFYWSTFWGQAHLYIRTVTFLFLSHIPVLQSLSILLVHFLGASSVCPCLRGEEAAHLKSVLKERFSECRLELHQEKTKIVYCKDSQRGCAYPLIRFDFLGYTFRPRRAKTQRGKVFTGFNPAISNKAAKAIFAEVRSWKLHLRSAKSLEDLAGMFKVKIRGWINYYGAFYRSALNKILWKIDCRLVRWAMRKCKRLRNHKGLAVHWLKRIACKQPGLFAHWQNVIPKTG